MITSENRRSNLGKNFFLASFFFVVWIFPGGGFFQFGKFQVFFF
uniref:Uncharacterized protein n=1 Tax=viral metagenome TaxID=1070528 RepID=A0A6C0BMT7_9ZZZZ